MILGLSRGEIVFVLMILALVFGWSWVPRIGARIGAMLAPGERSEDRKG